MTTDQNEIGRIMTRLYETAIHHTAQGVAPRWRGVLLSHTEEGHPVPLYWRGHSQTHTTVPAQAYLVNTIQAASTRLPDGWVWELDNLRAGHLFRFEYSNDSKETEGTIRAETLYQATQALKALLGHKWRRSMARTSHEDNGASIIGYKTIAKLSATERKLQGWEYQPSLYVSSSGFEPSSNIQTAHVMAHAADILRDGIKGDAWAFTSDRPQEDQPRRPYFDPLA